METKKVALITGVPGQDGSYLAEFLLKKRVYSTRPQAPKFALQYGPYRPPLPGPAYREPQLYPPLRGDDRLYELNTHYPGCAAR